MEKVVKLADIRRLNKQVSLGEISSTRMVEIINEMAYEVYCKAKSKNYKTVYGSKFDKCAANKDEF
jgi:hypothetical protein